MPPETSPSRAPAADVRTDGAEALTAGEREVVAIFVQLASTLGAPRSLGEIYGLLYATPRPLPFQEIVDRLGISKGSVSQGLRFLRTVGAVQTATVEADRREHFEPVVELRQLVGGFIRERIEPGISDWGRRSRGLRAEHFVRDGGLTSAELKTLEGRLGKLTTWHKRAALVLPTLGRLLG